ncbi:XRN 5'-3' exonuclease N-terminus family protein [Leishmania donovani]|uniref:XRN 5'-3' exonuclease N-terminus family protein n=1 Tax=Leishmania donovani TaxID=5661 RepID=A0A504WYH2_LEIDO|nr:XRN 5'-3' exonuclease N-terminus family protein [Leishmania donovani]
MGLLGLRKFIDSCGCTRLLPVPLSDAEAAEEVKRRLRVEGCYEITGEDADADSGALYANSGEKNETDDVDRRGARRRPLTSSSHMSRPESAGAVATGSYTPMVDHVMVDMNCVVHSCFRHQCSENKPKRQLIQEVLERLRVLVTEVVVPRQSLSICFDGPAPIAKLQTQRLRRRKVSLLDTGSVQQLNTLSITAGSLFMIELENAIASQFKLNRGRGFLRRACPVYLYGTTVMGEGEAKISRALAFLAYGSDDTVVVMGDDIDLVLTCLGATAFHNFSIISPSSLQLIRVSDILYRWLKATSATRGDTPFSPSQLPSIRIDFIFLFLLNGGDHYTGAGEVAMALWRRYRCVRATYPHSTLVSPNLDAIDIDFLADVVQSSEYTGSSSIEVGMDLLQSALWSLHTVVTGVCPDYHYVPAPAAPQLCHLRAAAAHCQRTNARICLPNAKTGSQPLTPLETYVALMPTEATLPKSIAAGLHSKAAYQSILKTLETSSDTASIARAAKDAVEVSAPWLTKSEQYLRHFTSPVQLNVNPPRRRLSRHEQHRMLATHGYIQVEDPVPEVRPIRMPENVPYLNVPYLPYTKYLDFYCPFDVATAQPQKPDEGDHATLARQASGGPPANGGSVTPQDRMHANCSGDGTVGDGSDGAAGAEGRSAEHKRVYLNQEEAAEELRQRERKSAAAKLQPLMSDAADEHADVAVDVRGAGVVASSGKVSTTKKNLKTNKDVASAAEALSSRDFTVNQRKELKTGAHHDSSHTNAGRYEDDMTASTVPAKQRKRRATVPADADSHADVGKASTGLKQRRRERIESFGEDSARQRTPSGTKKRRRVQY